MVIDRPIKRLKTSYVQIVNARSLLLIINKAVRSANKHFPMTRQATNASDEAFTKTLTYSRIPDKFAAALHNIVLKYRPKRAIEIGHNG